MKAIGLFFGLMLAAQAGLAANLDLKGVLDQCQNLSGKAAGQFEGKAVVVTFGATWCPSCNALLPRNETLAEQYAGKVEFIEIDLGNSVLADAQQAAHAYPAFSFYLNDPDTLSNALGLQAYPTTVVMDKNGNEVFHGFADDDFASYQAMVDSVSK